MNTINGYQLTSELKNDNSGYAKWGFAIKDGQEYFIKEFLTPIYPIDTNVISEEQAQRKRDICADFEYRKRSFYDKLNQCSTGNIVTVKDFFRWMNKYYIVTEKIDATPIKPEDIAGMTIDQKLLIIKVILYCVNSLHEHNIVHGDIKPDNILFKQTRSGMYTAKIIDFDSSFLEEMPPEDEELQGDMVYLAPESFLLMAEGDVKLTKNIDVFALGVLFHQYFSGDLPEFDTEEYNYAFEAVLDGCDLRISDKVPEDFREMLANMLKLNPEERPSMQRMFSRLAPKAHEKEKNEEENSVVIGGVKSKLKSTMRTSESPYYVEEKREVVIEKEEQKGSVIEDMFFRRADDLL